MDASETTQDQYASFLVRLWRSAEPRPNGSNGDWQGEVEHIQSGRRWRFASLAGLDRILRQPCGVAEAQSPGESR
jgi:hypothetical protein